LPRRVDIALAALAAAREEADAPVAEWREAIKAVEPLPQLAVAGAARIHQNDDE
jgi:hypothetical protein